MKLKKSKYLFAALLLASSIGLSACSQNESKEETKTEQSSTEYAKVQTMKGADLEKIEDDKNDKEKYLVIDVRSPEEYNEGHVKFAINMPIDTFESDYKNIESFKDKDVALYCNSGKKSGQAADILVKNGFTKVYNADGVKQYDYKLVKFGNLLGADFEKAIADKKAQLVIDARDAKDFEENSFKDAVNIMPDDFEAKKSTLPKDKKTAIYVYCYSGNKSSKIAQSLIDEGYTTVVNSLDGSKEYEFKFDKK